MNLTVELSTFEQIVNARQPIPALLSSLNADRRGSGPAPQGGLGEFDQGGADLPTLTATFLPWLSCNRSKGLLEDTSDPVEVFSLRQDLSGVGCWMLLRHPGIESPQLASVVASLQKTVSNLTVAGEEQARGVQESGAAAAVLGSRLSQHIKEVLAARLQRGELWLIQGGAGQNSEARPGAGPALGDQTLPQVDGLVVEKGSAPFRAQAHLGSNIIFNGTNKP